MIKKETSFEKYKRIQTKMNSNNTPKNIAKCDRGLNQFSRNDKIEILLEIIEQ
ncbi:MAG: hypothetical protein V4538_00835 [Bacteroidota bacterium]